MRLTFRRHAAIVLKALVPAGIAVAVGVSATTAPAVRTSTGADCARTSAGLTPLTDLGTRTYGGFRGGIYPGGKNVPSARYLAKGLALVRQIQPRGPDGAPSVGGRIVLLSIGMSNTTQEYSAFKRLADRDARKRSQVVVVDGAQGGQDAERIKDPGAEFWSRIDQRLEAAGVTTRQVQAIWLKEAIARPTERFPADARRLQADLRAIVRILRARYANLRVIYLSSRTYAGYATTPLNPEPYAYQSGFAVKWLIQERIEEKLKGPWLGWGPYLWTDGTKGRKDGLTWTCEDVRQDGTHPSDSGRGKVAALLLRFFTTDRTARGWFVG